jgi:hypothetical protein
MRYCVLLKISKQVLTFWYQLEGGTATPLSINGSNAIPFYFYVDGNDFKIGDFARERYLINDKNAYFNYFELIKDPSKHFVLHGDSKPIKQLLYYGVENILSHFIKTILFKNESIEGFRTNICLQFWFDDDIENQERVLVQNLFKEAGYENAEEINADLFLNKELNLEIKSSKSRICLSAISNDLFVKLFKSPSFNLASQLKLEHLGSDPRAKIIAKLILEDIKEANPHIYIEEEKDIAHIINHCAELLSSLTLIMEGRIELSNGIKADYRIKNADLESRMIYNKGVEDKVIPELERIIAANGLNISLIDVILIGDELNTNYFKDRLNKKFSNVYGIGSLLQDKILNLIFANIAASGYQIKKVGNFQSDVGVNDAPIVVKPPILIIPPIISASGKPSKDVISNDKKKIGKLNEPKTAIVAKPIKNENPKTKPDLKTPIVNIVNKETKKIPPPPPPPPPNKK